jgi:hypothetical protein
MRQRPLPNRYACNFRLPIVSPAREIMGAKFSGHFACLRARLAFCKPSLPDYLRVISGTGRGT